MLKDSLVELRKFVDTRAPKVLIALAVIGALIGPYLIARSNKPAGSASVVPVDIYELFTSQSIFFALMLGFVGLLGFTQEWSQKGGQFTFLLSPSRTRVLVAKILATGLLVILATAVLLALVAVVSVGLDMIGLPTKGSLSAVQIGQVCASVGLSIFLGAALGALFCNSTLAIVVLLAGNLFLLALGTAVPGLRKLLDWTALANWEPLTGRSSSGNISSETAIEVGKVLATAGFWIVLPFLLAVVIWNKREAK